MQIHAVSTQGKIVKSFDSVIQGALWANRHPSTISRAVSGSRGIQSSANLFWVKA